MLNNMGNLKPSDQFKGVTFIGKVVDNTDPSHMERVKVRIPQIFDGVEDADLPWCIPMLGRVQGGTGTVHWFGVPVIGALLYIEFQMGDPHFPVYKGGVVSAASKAVLADTNYPHRWGWVDEKGNHYYSDTSTGDIELRHFSGTTVHISPAGAVNVTTVSNVAINVTGTTSLTATGAVTVHSNASVSITAPSVSIN